MDLERMLFLDPDTGGGAGGSTDGSTPQSASGSDATAAASDAGVTGQPSAPPPTVGDASTAAGGTPSQPPLREYVQQRYGIDPGEDDQALHNLAMMARQAQAIAQDPSYRTWQTDRDKYLAWRDEQAKTQQATQAQQEKWWNAPEWNDSWLGQLEQVKNPVTGEAEIRAVAGADPSIADKYRKYQAFQRDALNKIARNPSEALAGWKQEIIKEAMAEVRKEFDQQNRINTAYAIVEQNTPWVYDANRQPTPEGRMYLHGVQAARETFGINEPVKIDAFAKMFARDTIMQQRLAADQKDGKAKQDFSQRANRQPTMAAPTNGPSDTVPEGLSFRDDLAQRLKAEGVTSAS